jgi:hypothetical protein
MHFAVVTILINLDRRETAYHDGFKMWNMVGTWSERGAESRLRPIREVVKPRVLEGNGALHCDGCLWKTHCSFYIVCLN